MGTEFKYQEKRLRGNAPVVSSSGEVVNMDFQFDYLPEMQKKRTLSGSESKEGGEEYALPAIKVADGILLLRPLLR